MALLDGPMRALAQNLAGKFGISGTLTRITSDGYNPTLGDTDPTTATHTVAGVLEEMREDEFGQSLGGGGVIQHGDLKYTIHAQGLSVTPDPETDTVAVDGVTYTLVGVKPVYSGEQVALFTLVLRN